MWKMIPASVRDYDFTDHKIQMRRGSSVVGTATVTDSKNDIGFIRKLIVVKDNQGDIIERRTLLNATNKNLRTFVGHFYGVVLFIWEDKPNVLKTLSQKEDKINKSVKPTPAPEKNMPANTLILVGKPFTKLVDGLRLHFKPYVGNGFIEYDAVVSRHTMCNNPMRPEVIQVHVQKDGVPFTTFSFTEKLEEKTVADIPFFEKFSAYVVKNYKKVETVNQKLCPNGAKAIPERDDSGIKIITAEDEQGKYIIWCPTSDRPPQKILCGQKQAKAVAADISERHGKVFYWARLMGVAKQVNKEVVTVKRVTETVTL